MKKHFILSVLVIQACFVQAQNVDIPDVNFKQALVGYDIINTNHDEEISKEEALKATDIYVPGLGISNLKGIEAFTNVVSMTLDYNVLTSVDLSSNGKLASLTLNGNQLQTLDVSNNADLTRLTCDGNKLTSLILAENLQTLSCHDNLLDTINLTSKINQLDCSNNPLKGLDFSHLSLLSNLNCSNNGITELKVPMSIQTLYCRANLLTVLNLTNYPNLQILDCAENQLSQLGLPVGLTNLNCSRNALSVFDVSMYPHLYTLDCSHNPLKHLKMAALMNQLNCSDNLLDSLDVSANPQLYILNCTHNANLKMICVPSITLINIGTYQKDSAAVWSLCREPHPPIVCTQHIAPTGLCEDFKDADASTEVIEEYAVATDKLRWENGVPSPGNYAYMGMFWTEADHKNGFTATKSRKGDGVIKYKVSQMDSIYEPFMVVFGSYAEGDMEKKLSVDLTHDKTLSFDFKNLGATRMNFYVQLEDIKGNSLVFDQYTLTMTNNQDWAQIGYESIGWSDSDYQYQNGQSTFSYDFGNAVCGITVTEYDYIYNEAAPDSVFDYSHVVMVKFFPSGYINNIQHDNLVDQEIEISNFRLGDVDFVSQVSDVPRSSSSQTVYKVYDLLGHFVAEGREEDLDLATGRMYIFKSGHTTQKRIIVE